MAETQEAVGEAGGGQRFWEPSAPLRTAGSPRAAGGGERRGGVDSEEDDGEDDVPACPACARAFSLQAGRAPKELPCQHLCCLDCVVSSMCGSVAACAECGARHCLEALDAGSASHDDSAAASSCARALALARRLPTCLVLEELLMLLSPAHPPAGSAALLSSPPPSSRAACAPEAGAAGAVISRVAASPAEGASPGGSDQQAGAGAVAGAGAGTGAHASGQGRLASDDFVFDDGVAASSALTVPSSRFCIRMQKLSGSRAAAPADGLLACKEKPSSGESTGAPAAAQKKQGTRGARATPATSKRGSSASCQRRVQKNQVRGIDRGQDEDDDLLLDVPLSRLPAMSAPDDLLLDVPLSRLLPRRSETARAPASTATVTRPLSPCDDDDLTIAQRREMLRARNLGQHQPPPDESAAKGGQGSASTAARAANGSAVQVSGAPRGSKQQRRTPDAAAGSAARWEDNFKALLEYRARFGHVCPPQVGCRLGWWATNQVCASALAHRAHPRQHPCVCVQRKETADSRLRRCLSETENQCQTRQARPCSLLKA